MTIGPGERPLNPEEFTYSDRHIALMPLHAVTETLGNEGLIRRFIIETERFSPTDRLRLNTAFNWAMDIHAGERRQREPTTNHLLRVAIRIMHHYKSDDVDLICAALLHDSVEDHADLIVGSFDPSPYEAYRVLESRFGKDVATLVESVTNPSFDPSKKIEQYQHHVRELLLKGDPRSRLLKVSDFTDNALGSKYMDTEGATYRAHRYLPLVDIFKEAIAMPDTPVSEEVRQHILAQLDETAVLLSGLIEVGDGPQSFDALS